MAEGNRDNVAPSGKFRVFSWVVKNNNPSATIVGDFDTREAALATAWACTSKSTYATIYNDKGECVDSIYARRRDQSALRLIHDAP
jgi:hypothetical protein